MDAERDSYFRSLTGRAAAYNSRSIQVQGGHVGRIEEDRKPVSVDIGGIVGLGRRTRQCNRQRCIITTGNAGPIGRRTKLIWICGLTNGLAIADRSRSEKRPVGKEV